MGNYQNHGSPTDSADEAKFHSHVIPNFAQVTHLVNMVFRLVSNCPGETRIGLSEPVPIAPGGSIAHRADVEFIAQQSIVTHAQLPTGLDHRANCRLLGDGETRILPRRTSVYVYKKGPSNIAATLTISYAFALLRGRDRSAVRLDCAPANTNNTAGAATKR